ncbi:MAG: hypothetical protein HZB68_04205 [Candidatus Aenigmarchaeota archaeon]|nr:hypothetical protein [Candidatus Aenigmarchaeota archaeon]
MKNKTLAIIVVLVASFLIIAVYASFSFRLVYFAIDYKVPKEGMTKTETSLCSFSDGRILSDEYMRVRLCKVGEKEIYEKSYQYGGYHTGVFHFYNVNESFLCGRTIRSSANNTVCDFEYPKGNCTEEMFSESLCYKELTDFLGAGVENCEWKPICGTR